MSVETNSSLVTAGKPKVAGAIYCAPVSENLPATAYANLSANFACCGYISENGVENSHQIESSDVKAWGGDTVATLHTGRPDKWSFTMIEAMNANVLKIYYGDSNVSGSLTSNTGLVVTATADALTSHAYVIDMVLNGNIPKRIVIPDGTVSDTAAVTYKDNEIVGYNVTITASPDSNGATHHEYIGGNASA